jgi:hypothetical protein
MKKQLSIWQEIENPQVRMHNHLVTANFGYLELNAMRIFLLMLAKLEWDATDFSPIRINLQDIDSNCFGGKNFDLIMKAMDELKTKMKDVRILSIENGKKTYERMSVIDNIKYTEGTDYMTATFGTAVRPYLLQLRGNFTQAELRELMKLKSTYSIRLYMLVKSLFRAGQVYSTSFDDLKQMLIGNTDTYSMFRDFKRRVLQPTQKALEKTSAAFHYEEVRKGKAVASLRIWPVTYPNSIEASKVMADDLKATLDELKVNTARIIQMLESNEITEGYISFVIESKQKDKKVKKIGGAIHDAVVNKQLWEDYQNSLKKIVSTPIRITAVNPSDTDIKTISLHEAQQMYEEEKAAGKTKYPFGGFVKAIKIGRNILVQDYNY